MRIAFTTTEFITEENFAGGLANYLYRLCLGLTELKHETHVFIVSDKEETFKFKNIFIHRVKVMPYYNILIKFFQFITFNKLKNSINAVYASYLLNRSIKKLHKVKPFDIIQYSSYTATGFFRQRNIPSVVRISSFEKIYQEARGITNPNLDQRASRWIEMSSFKKADSIFGPGILIAKAVEKVSKRQVEVIETPFILDTHEFDESLYLKMLKGKKYFLYWGTLGIIKGIKLIEDTIFKILDNHKDFYFVFAGKDEGMIEKIKKKASMHSNRVLYLGKLKHSELYPIIKNAFAAILPSKMDNFPNTCLEAFAFKKIVIGTYGSSFEQLITDNVSGFLIKPDNTDELLQAVDKIVGLTDQERDTIQSMAYRRVMLNNKEKVIKQLIDFYSKTITNYERKKI